MTTAKIEARTFHALSGVDLEQVYLQGKEEMLRSRAFRILLAHADTIPKLEKLAFEGERGLDGWTTEELLEISNRFRLLSSPENEIRLYRQCHDEIFRASARVREFYILALNRIGRSAEAIEEALDILATGGHNALIWGMLGESYSARMMFAEQLAAALKTAHSSHAPIYPELTQKLQNHFPELAVDDLSLARVDKLRQENLLAADRIFRQGFRETGTSFCGLGWMFRTLDRLADAAQIRTAIKVNKANEAMDACEQKLNGQAELVAIALTMQGGSESLDYWTHAGSVQLAVIHAHSSTALHLSLARASATADAAFKFSITIRELERIHTQFAQIRQAMQSIARDTHEWDARLERAQIAITALMEGRTQFATSRANPSETLAQEKTTSLDWILKKTINFRALAGNLVPLYIGGTIGRVGARVPDLMINRRVQEDLLDLLEDRVVWALSPEDRDNPLAVIARIQQVVGAALRLEELQDLQSPGHAAFDARSDGLIALSGVDHDMRKDTRTGTDLTAALLMQTGDCRETMYLNGALFACWQQLQTRRHIATAVLCLELGYQAGFQRIVREALPAILRYQLRGGQAAIFVESIAMEAKYQCQQMPDGTARLRPYGLAELRAAQPLTRYELENSRIEVTYRDGSVSWIDSESPIATDSGGVPVIPNAGGADLENIHSIRLLHLVEDHAMTFLYDAEQGETALYDGFYNENLFPSPYPFAFRSIKLNPDATQDNPLIHVAERTLSADDGSHRSSPVYLRFLPFSHTDYAVGLTEGDIPGRLQLMGRTFNADFKFERRLIEEARSPIPAVMENIQRWQMARNDAPEVDRATLDRQLARLMLNLAKDQSELVQFKEVGADQVLIREECENDQVYLVLSGQLQIYRNGSPLIGKEGNAQVVASGGVVGEISALSGGLASATVQGHAVVLGISKQVIQQQLESHPALRQSMEALANSRVM